MVLYYVEMRNKTRMNPAEAVHTITLIDTYIGLQYNINPPIISLCTQHKRSMLYYFILHVHYSTELNFFIFFSRVNKLFCLESSPHTNLIVFFLSSPAYSFCILPPPPPCRRTKKANKHSSSSMPFIRPSLVQVPSRVSCSWETLDPPPDSGVSKVEGGKGLSQNKEAPKWVKGIVTW